MEDVNEIQGLPTAITAEPEVSETAEKAEQKTMPALEAAEAVKHRAELWPTPIPLPLRDGRQPADVQTEIEFSEGLEGWLQERSVSLAFTTYDSGHLFLVGVLPNGKLSIFQRHFPRAMGLAYHNDRLFVASKDYLWRLENIVQPPRLANDRFDRAFVPRSAQTTGGLDVHEIAINRDGRLIFVNTRFSCIGTTHPKHSFAPLWKPSFITGLKGEDRCHLNGMAMVDGQPRYVTAFFPSDEKRGWREKPSDEGIIIDIRTQRIVSKGFVKPHSPRFYNGALYVLDSGRGSLVRVDPVTGSQERIAFLPGFLRGLSFLGNYALINSSLPRDKIFAGMPLEDSLKERGLEAWCGVYIVDLVTGATLHWVRLKGRIREMFDVIFLENTRCPMLIGLGTRELSGLITIGRPEGQPGGRQGQGKAPPLLPGRPVIDKESKLASIK
jgi:uncharacterized protein (TIGR03032 family)